MKIVAIVCEYNPFHNGHKHQIEQIKKTFGPDAAIVAIMSGNYVQRGDLAILGKFQRARMAVECGVSLVLEIPFPFSLSSAEGFASAAVEIAHKLGTVDILSFGSECGDINTLRLASEHLSSDAFNSALKQIIKTDGNETLGYAKARTIAFQKLYGEGFTALLSSPNNILAIEYLKALRRLGSTIKAHTILRNGTDKDGALASTSLAGATYLRSLLYGENSESALPFIPTATHEMLRKAYKNGEMPVKLDNLSCALLSSLRLENKNFEIAECGGGLYGHLRHTAQACGTLEELFQTVSTKKYTDARIRRATLYSYFGVTPAHLRESVMYTQVLAMDGIGQAVLHHIRKTAEIALITKPADTGKLPAQAKMQAERAYRADSVYTLAMPKPKAADFFLTVSPYRK